MKVGVITFHSAYNFGASLQTWALQKVLRNYGLESSVIHYHPAIIDDLYDPIKQTGIKRPFKIIKLRMTKKKSLKRHYNYQNFVKKNFNLIGDFKTYEELSQANLALDAYITGSDQVWNSQHIDGFDPAYYLDFVQGDAMKVSYAASIGRNYILPRYREQVIQSLSGFNAISVREESAMPVIQALTDKAVEVVLDPTLLLKRADYEEIKVKQDIGEKYIFVYMMEDNRDVVTFANRISRLTGYPIIQRRPNKRFKNEIESCFTKTPGDFLGLIEGAELVITNSFHGTVFSIIYEKSFLSMLHSDTGSRTIDLLESLKLSSHIVYDINEFSDMDQAKLVEADRVRRSIAAQRIHSLNFLESALGITDKAQMVECPTNIRKDQCYGCYACKEVCPTDAIAMVDDKEGFKYPIVDNNKCIHCNACEKACIRKAPHLLKFAQEFPKIFSAINKDDEVRAGSSSGAIFPALAQYFIDKKGYVVGVKFDENMKVVSAIADNMEDVKAFYGSKYVKSDFEGIFPKIKELLKGGHPVLYSGLPCECAGLRSYLRKDYDNLVIAELICHASPSPKVFERYVDYLSKKFKSKITSFEFRNKSTGWEIHKCSLIVNFENGKELKVNSRRNNYFRAFINDFISRPCCNNCNYTYKKRVGDISMGDFWGIKTIDPEMYDNKGCSMLLINNQKALGVWNGIADKFVYKETDWWTAFKKNHSKPSPHKMERMDLFRNLDEEPIDSLLLRFNDLKQKQ